MARTVPLAYTNAPDPVSGHGIIARLLSTAKRALNAEGVADAEQDEKYLLYSEILNRKNDTESEAAQRAALYRRMDNLYYPSVVTKGGADHWSDDDSAVYNGRVHVSVNTPQVYVDIPASLQAIPPYVNAVPDGPTQRDQQAADRREKLLWGWWDENDMDLRLQELTQARGLYSVAAIKVWWDKDRNCPVNSVVESIENLRIGWGASDFSRKDWALYNYGLSPQSVREEFGDLDVEWEKVGSDFVPVVYAADHSDPLNQRHPEYQQPYVRSQYERQQIDVYDYWYKVAPKRKGGKPQIWNAIYCGNHQVENRRHPEFDDIPYVWFPNGKVPGSPYGRSELYDLEQLFREQDERFSGAGQMIEQVIGGQMWKVEGAEAPEMGLVDGLVPRRNRVVSPGPNAQLNPITPAVPMFQVEEYLSRLDKKITEISGISDLLLGVVPGRAFGSSKAINALLQMYEPRIGLKRQLLYRGLRELWTMTAKVWEAKDPSVAKLIDGNYRIEVKPPELQLRDDQEQANRVVTLVQNRVWSQRRAMDATGVDNPSDEIATIKEEQTDASLNPRSVQEIATVLATLKQLGYGNPEQAQQTAQQAAGAAVNPREQAAAAVLAKQKAVPPGGAPPPGGGQSANVPAAGAPENTPANAQAANGAPLTLQTMVQNGEASGRILGSTQLGGGQ